MKGVSFYVPCGMAHDWFLSTKGYIQFIGNVLHGSCVMFLICDMSLTYTITDLPEGIIAAN